jgi:hypothetical protein
MAYSTIDTIKSADKVFVEQSESGLPVLASAAVLAAFIQSEITTIDDKITQYASPSASGFSVAVQNASESVWLLLTPTAGFATGTLVLPASVNCVDNQEILVNSTQAVTTLTITGNGSSVTGAPTTLAANAFFRLRYNAVNSTWYRVG